MAYVGAFFVFWGEKENNGVFDFEPKHFNKLELVFFDPIKEIIYFGVFLIGSKKIFVKKRKEDKMIRGLNVLQGVISLVLVLMAALFEWPVIIPVFGIVLPAVIGVAIVFGFRGEETPKGRSREVVEVISGLGFGVIGLLIWVLAAETKPTLESPTPWWMVFVAMPSVVFNLAIYFAGLLRAIWWLFEKLTQLLEWAAGETVEDMLGGLSFGEGGDSSSSRTTGRSSSGPE